LCVFLKAEQHNIICDHASFIIISDKLNSDDAKNIHLIAFVKNKELMVMTDIRQKHIPLISEIRDTGIKYLCSEHGFSVANTNVYFNYPPSIYLLHIHFTYKDYNHDSNIRHYNVNDVIYNVTKDECYYDRTLNIESVLSVQLKK
jgi:hypothetical protein